MKNTLKIIKIEIDFFNLKYTIQNTKLYLRIYNNRKDKTKKYILKCTIRYVNIGVINVIKIAKPWCDKTLPKPTYDDNIHIYIWALVALEILDLLLAKLSLRRSLCSFNLDARSFWYSAASDFAFAILFFLSAILARFLWRVRGVTSL